MNEIYDQNKIKDKVVSTTTDNGYNFETTFKDFGMQGVFDIEEDMDNEDFQKSNFINIDHENPVYNKPPDSPKIYRSATLLLSLVATTDAKVALNVQSFAMVNQMAMATCSALWREIKKSEARDRILNILGSPLYRPCNTKWYSFFVALKQIVESKNMINEVMKQLNLPFFTQQDIDFIEEYLCVLKPIAVGIERLQGNKNLYYGELIPTLLTIHSQLYEIPIEQLRYCSYLLNVIREGFHRRFKSFIELDETVDDALLATVTHPYFKLRWVVMKSDANIASIKTRLQDLLIAQLKSLSHKEKREAAAKSSNDDYYKFEDNTAENESNADLKALRFLEDNDFTVKALQKHPSIKRLFMKYNSTLTSTAPVEKLFPFQSILNSVHRSRLSDKTFEALSLLKNRPKT